ncbi:MAG: 3-deoxy-manno-octulosonate cytidylyltransferase, partial [Spirochaetia bacterium]|nr:3-deoxy-manno-octulosonate cytidylyltransferase [Spirochaetia bacterium]
ARSKKIDKLLVATDSKKIFACVLGFGGTAVMTSPTHATGSDRIWEVAEAFPGHELILNIQGDEPFVNERVVDELIQPFLTDPTCLMSTLRKKITTGEEKTNPNIVKVVCDRQGRALYFSRASLPYDRDGKNPEMHRHIGLYGYRRDFLNRYRNLKQTPLELAESLEQLRVLENGVAIHVVETNEETVDVNAPEDLLRAEKMLAKKK